MIARIHERLSEIARSDWNILDRGSFPFSRHEYLSALEDTCCVGPDTGWRPFYIAVYDDANGIERLIAASSIYAKSHSYGEYVFDFAWAQAFEGHGLRYYPKLVAAIPFAPATGAKILLLPGLSRDSQAAARSAILKAWRTLARELDASSTHALFPTETECADLEATGFIRRMGLQFHWHNQGYSSFDDFLSRLRSKRRRETRRERAEAAAPGLTIERLSGSDLTSDHADAMRAFYHATVDKRMGHRYLTDDFFDAAFAPGLRENALFVYAREGSRPVAGALGYFEGDALFGRWWGALEERRALHFELSYYQGIEHAIANKLSLFEAGAQGEHKLARGFLPQATLSAHEIYDPRFASAIRAFCAEEAEAIAATVIAYNAQTPYQRASEADL